MGFDWEETFLRGLLGVQNKKKQKRSKETHPTPYCHVPKRQGVAAVRFSSFTARVCSMQIQFHPTCGSVSWRDFFSTFPHRHRPSASWVNKIKQINDQTVLNMTHSSISTRTTHSKYPCLFSLQSHSTPNKTESRACRVCVCEHERERHFNYTPNAIDPSPSRPEQVVHIGKQIKR